MRYLITIMLLAMVAFAESDLKFDPIITSEGLFIIDDLGGNEAGHVVPGFNKIGGTATYKGVSATVVTELTPDMEIGISKAFVNWRPVELSYFKIGYANIPFGEYKSNLVNFPLIRYGTDRVQGISTSAVLYEMGTNILGVNAIGCIYSDESGLVQSVAGKLKYNVKDIVNFSFSGRGQEGHTYDLDLAIECTPVSWLSIIAEGYKGVKNDKLGYYTEVGFIPHDNIILSIRHGAILDNVKNSYGTSQLSAGPLFIVNDYFVIGIEWNVLYDVQNGTYKDSNHSLATMLSFSL